MRFLLFLLGSLTLSSVHCDDNQYDYIYDNYDNTTIESVGFSNVPRADVLFRLWTRDQNQTYKLIYQGELQNEPSIRPNEAFKIIIHGYTSNPDKPWVVTLKNVYLQKDNYNVILVDWSKLSNSYLKAAGYSKSIGGYVGQLIIDLHKTLGVPYANIHVIGHSLAAHIAGFSGQYVYNNMGIHIGRITGLDPASPLFRLAKEKNKINKDNGDFVDIIHTDGMQFGLFLPHGHIDFYPNGGTAIQPECTVPDESHTGFGSCSHFLAHEYFIESVNSTRFIAKKCSNFIKYMFGLCQFKTPAIMGENCNHTARGVYSLAVNYKTPYAKNGRRFDQDTLYSVVYLFNSIVTKLLR